MPKWYEYLKPLGTGNKLFSNADQKFKNFFMGTPEKHERISTLLPEQQNLYQQLQNSAINPNAGGAFGNAADYYRDLLSNDSQTANQMFAPEMRRFNEDIVPGLAEQFAGMGSGGLSSSGFRNATINAGTDLSERLGAIRANLRAQGAAGLANIGQLGLGNYSQDVMTQPGSPGFLSQLAPAAGTAVGAFFGGPGGAALGNSLGNLFSSKFGKSSPYGNYNYSQPLSQSYDTMFRQQGV